MFACLFMVKLLVLNVLVLDVVCGFIRCCYLHKFDVCYCGYFVIVSLRLVWLAVCCLHGLLIVLLNSFVLICVCLLRSFVIWFACLIFGWLLLLIVCWLLVQLILVCFRFRLVLILLVVLLMFYLWCLRVCCVFASVLFAVGFCYLFWV